MAESLTSRRGSGSDTPTANSRPVASGKSHSNCQRIPDNTATGFRDCCRTLLVRFEIELRQSCSQTMDFLQLLARYCREAPSPESLCEEIAVRCCATELALEGEPSFGADISAAAASVLRNEPWPTVAARLESLDKNRSVAHRLRDHIESHHHRCCSLEALSRDFGLSRRTLTRTFRREFGYTVRDYVILTRLRDAAERLAYSDDKISAVAAASGIGSSSSLHRWLSQVTASRHLVEGSRCVATTLISAFADTPTMMVRIRQRSVRANAHSARPSAGRDQR